MPSTRGVGINELIGVEARQIDSRQHVLLVGYRLVAARGQQILLGAHEDPPVTMDDGRSGAIRSAQQIFHLYAGVHGPADPMIVTAVNAWRGGTGRRKYLF